MADFFLLLYLPYEFLKASDQPFDLNTKLIDSRIDERVDGELLYLNGASLLSSTIMNKSVYQS